MAQSSRIFRNVAASVVVLSCLGGAAWLLLPEGEDSPVEAVKSAVRDVAEKVVSVAGDGERGDAGTREQGGTEKSGRIRQVQSAQEVSSAISREPRPVQADPREELLSRVERAMEGPVVSVPGGDAVTGPVEDRPPVQEEKRQDSVVTGAFVRDMGRWLAASYTPSRREGRPGRSSATLVRGNFRYSYSSTLRSAERDPMKSRSSILNYVFTPGMLEALYRMYAPGLVEEMERAARAERGGRVLSDTQVADMFQVYAGKFERLSASLSAAAAVDLPALSQAIRRAELEEREANDDFARAYTALSHARETGDREEVNEQNRRMEESTRTAGVHAERQELARADMARALRRHAGTAALPDAELVFLGEWLSRHDCSVEATRKAADISRRMAALCRTRAEAILAPEKTSAAEKTPDAASARTQEEAQKAGATAPERTEARSPATGTAGFAPSERSASGTEVSGRLNALPAPAAEQTDAAGHAPAAPQSAPSAAAPAPEQDAAAEKAAVPATSPAAAVVPSPASPDAPSAEKPAAPVASESAPTVSAGVSSAAPEPVPASASENVSAAGNVPASAPEVTAVEAPAAPSATPPSPVAGEAAAVQSAPSAPSSALPSAADAAPSPSGGAQ